MKGTQAATEVVRTPWPQRFPAIDREAATTFREGWSGASPSFHTVKGTFIRLEHIPVVLAGMHPPRTTGRKSSASWKLRARPPRAVPKRRYRRIEETRQAAIGKPTTRADAAVADRSQLQSVAEGAPVAQEDVHRSFLSSQNRYTNGGRVPLTPDRPGRSPLRHRGGPHKTAQMVRPLATLGNGRASRETGRSRSTHPCLTTMASPTREPSGFFRAPTRTACTSGPGSKF